MKRTLLFLAVAAAIAWPLLVSSNDSLLRQTRSARSKTVRVANSGSLGSSSANYSVPSDSIDGGGAPAQSANYSVYAGAIGEFDAANSAVIASTNYYLEIGEGISGLEGPMIAVSRKKHGFAGTFDQSLPFSGPVGIECRNVGALPGGATGDYQLVMTFAEAVTVSSASVAAGSGTVPPGGASASGNQITVNLTGVANAQTISVMLSGVSDGPNTVDVSVPMAVLVGDTNADRFTDAVDVSQTKSQSGNAVTNGNFREDVNVDGFIDAVDVSLVKSKSGTALQ
jgi:hypothetical protein